MSILTNSEDLDEMPQNVAIIMQHFIRISKFVMKLKKCPFIQYKIFLTVKHNPSLLKKEVSVSLDSIA